MDPLPPFRPSFADRLRGEVLRRNPDKSMPNPSPPPAPGSPKELLLHAALDGNLRTLKKIVKAMDGGEGRIAEKVGALGNDCGLGVLHLAAASGKLPVCRYLVEELCLDVKANCQAGITPLTCAIDSGSVDVVQYLLDHGADTEPRLSTGLTPLVYAVGKGNFEIVQALLSKGAHIDVLTTAGAALHCAAEGGRHDIVKILLDHHADAGADVQGVVQAGADPNVNDSFGFTLIENAACYSKREDVEILFPVTSCIPSVHDWSVDGIIGHGKSLPALKKCDEHMNENDEEHKVFILNELSRPSNSGYGMDPLAGPNDEDENDDDADDDDNDEDDEDYENERSDDEDSLIPSDDDDLISDPTYSPFSKAFDQSLEGTNALKNSDYSDDSRYEEESSTVIPCVFQVRTLKNLKLNADERKEMRLKYVLCEARQPAVALSRVKNERQKYEKKQFFRMRGKKHNGKSGFVFDRKLGQLCLKKLKFYKVTPVKGFRIYNVLGMLEELLEDELTAGLRENSLHYMYPDRIIEPNLKEEDLQERINGAVYDICAKTLTSRESFKLRPAPKGMIAGAVKLYGPEGVLVDCNLGGASGMLIPSEADLITRVELTDEVLAVLLVEKDTAFYYLIGQHFHKLRKCILITGRGQPDVATRILLRKIKDSCPNVRFFGLMDPNPSGVQIMATYCFGSDSMAHDNLFLTVNDIEYIGLDIHDIATEDCKPLTGRDTAVLNNMLKKDYFVMTITGKALRESLVRMNQLNLKSDIDILIRKKELVAYILKKIPLLDVQVITDEAS
ncbi:hypothetical protein EJB05_23214 [Eragrostis curvula]|uniref:Topoisomerase 6 subunit A/Spo11 TOPRIM domain-containing protein n=1 Tax=Eragrostis curvula TaxID=38414 RepID=A0A5J9V7W6_9POAL|nr:hypothetical protein EJB05_23214 [Eragrostis curvula]